MSTSAPHTRTVNALNGKKAPDAFRKALSEADNFIAELDGVHELRARVAELEMALKLADADNGDLRRDLQAMVVEYDRVKAERDNLASDLVDLREAHMYTLTERARTRRVGW